MCEPCFAPARQGRHCIQQKHRFAAEAWDADGAAHLKKMILLSMILSNVPSALIKTPLQASRGSAPPQKKSFCHPSFCRASQAEHSHLWASTENTLIFILNLKFLLTRSDENSKSETCNPQKTL
jgi:hypothetical protein